MNKTKNIILGTLAVASVALASCSRNEFVEPEFVPKTFNLYSYQDLLFTGWELNSTQVGKPHSIMDMSTGYLSHTWSFYKEGVVGTELESEDWELAGDAIRFFTTANGEPPKNFGDDEDEDDFNVIEAYAPYYDLNKSCVNNDPVIAFLYTEPGRYKINVQNTYDSKISYEYARYRDEVTQGYVTQEYATPLANGTYEVNLDFEILIYTALKGKSLAYNDSEYSSPMDLETLNTHLVEGTEKTMSIPVKKGTTIYLVEDTDSTPWTGSSICTWGATYKFGPDIDAGLSETEQTMPVMKCVDGNTMDEFGMITKADKTYAPSKVAYTFDEVGATYQITMTQVRKAYRPEYWTETLEDEKTSTNSVGYMFTVVE